MGFGVRLTCPLIHILPLASCAVMNLVGNFSVLRNKAKTDPINMVTREKETICKQLSTVPGIYQKLNR